MPLLLLLLHTVNPFTFQYYCSRNIAPSKQSLRLLLLPTLHFVCMSTMNTRKKAERERKIKITAPANTIEARTT